MRIDKANGVTDYLTKSRKLICLALGLKETEALDDDDLDRVNSIEGWTGQSQSPGEDNQSNLNTSPQQPEVLVASEVAQTPTELRERMLRGPKLTQSEALIELFELSDSDNELGDNFFEAASGKNRQRTPTSSSNSPVREQNTIY